MRNKNFIASLVFLASVLFLFNHALPAADKAVAKGPAKKETAGGPAKIEAGKKVTLYYKLFVSGELLETADAKDPFTYQHGQHQIVPGLEKGLNSLHVGDKKTIQVLAAEAYGPVDSKAFREIEKTKLPGGVDQKAGMLLEARSPKGEVMLVKIKEVKDKTVVIDFNHPLAGKDLEFQVEVINIA